MNTLRLIKIIVIKNLLRDKFISILSIIGVALSVGLFVGVKISSDSAIHSFENEVKSMSTYTNYQIIDSKGIDFYEGVFERIYSINKDSLPLIKTFGYIPKWHEIVDINGILIIKAIKYFGDIKKGDVNIEGLYKDLNSVLITKKFSDKYSLKVGDDIQLVVYDRLYQLRIAGIVDSDFILENTFIMDLGNFQEYFDKVGFLSKIEIFSSDEDLERIVQVLPEDLRVESKEESLKNKKALTSSFRQNLQFVSFISILVGIFLLYNTIFITVVKRRTEIGILRGLGAEKRTIQELFIVQGLIIGIIGSLIGILIGKMLSHISVKIVEKTLVTMYITTTISEPYIKMVDIILFLLVGIFISLSASFIPAYEASKIKPNESIKEGSFEVRFKRYNSLFLTSGFALFILGLCISCYDYFKTPYDFPFLSYTGILLVILGFTLISPFYLMCFIRILKKPIELLFKFNGKIVIGDMNGNIYRFSVALMSVAISCALIIAIFILIYSLRSSLEKWINKNIVADIYIKPASCLSNYCFYPLSDEIIDIVKDFDEVAGIDRFRALNIDFNNKKVIAGFADISIKRKYYSKRYFDEKYDNVLREMEGDGQVVSISEYIALKYNLRVGDTINIKTPQGDKGFKIVDISSSYSTTSGFLYFDRKWLRRYWNLDDTTQFSIYVKEGVNVDSFIEKLKRRLLPVYSLEIMDNQELRDKIMVIFNRSFAITYAIETISIIISIIGLVNTLLALVFERKREISIIRYLGGTWRQIEKNFVLTSGTISILGLILGSLIGFLISLIFINVVNKISFGWEIHLKIPYFYISIVMCTLFLVSLMAGILPSRVAKRVDPKSFITFE